MPKQEKTQAEQDFEDAFWEDEPLTDEELFNNFY